MRPASGSGLLRQLGPSYGTEVLEASGLVLEARLGGHFDRFRGRLMFPIGNEAGKVIAFGGRALRNEDQPKYLNSSGNPHLSQESRAVQLPPRPGGMRRQGLVVLVEGYMDALAVFSAGVSNVVASCGTSLTLLQVKALAPLVKTVVVNYDPDAAGAAATERSLSTLLEEGLKVGVLELPTGRTPTSSSVPRDRKPTARNWRLPLPSSPFWWSGRVRCSIWAAPRDGPPPHVIFCSTSINCRTPWSEPSWPKTWRVGWV